MGQRWAGGGPGRGPGLLSKTLGFPAKTCRSKLWALVRSMDEWGCLCKGQAVNPMGTTIFLSPLGTVPNLDPDPAATLLGLGKRHSGSTPSQLELLLGCGPGAWRCRMTFDSAVAGWGGLAEAMEPL